MSARVIVTGSRLWVDGAVVHRALDTALQVFGPLVVVHGGCPSGADAAATVWAEQHRDSCELEVWLADWSAHGRAAGPRRNAAMVASGARFCLAFALPNGVSRGTEDTVRRARAAGIAVRRFEAQR